MAMRSASDIVARSTRAQPQKRIGELLVEAGLVKPEQIEEVLAEQRQAGGRTVQILIRKGYLRADTFVQFLAKHRRMASIDLKNYALSPDLVHLLPKDLARKHEVFPLDRLGRTLTIAMACPLDEEALGELRQATGLEIRTFLCNMEDVRKAIDRHYPEEPEEQPEKAPEPPPDLKLVESELKMERVTALVRAMEYLPSLPPTVQQLQAIIHDPEASMVEVAAIVERDPLASSKLLRLVNSAAFSFLQRVNTVRLAVTLLGLREIYMTLLASAARDLFRASPHFNYDHFWKKSTYCAALCKTIAEATGESRTAQFYTAGLLLDIGQVALAEAMPDVYGVIDQTLTGRALIAAEEKTLGLSHVEAGYQLAKNWNLPPELAEPIRFHHNPQDASQAVDVVQIAALAAAASDCLGASPETVQAMLQVLLTRLDSEAEASPEGVEGRSEENVRKLERLVLQETKLQEIMEKAEAICNDLGI